MTKSSLQSQNLIGIYGSTLCSNPLPHQWTTGPAFLQLHMLEVIIISYTASCINHTSRKHTTWNSNIGFPNCCRSSKYGTVLSRQPWDTPTNWNHIKYTHG